MKNLEKLIEAIASATHQVNRVWCIAHDDDSQLIWSDAPNWQKNSAINGVKGVLAGNTPEQSHESWLEQKKVDGWRFGDIKNADEKTHPCIVPYEDLDEIQKRKDEFFVTTVLQLARILDLKVTTNT